MHLATLLSFSSKVYLTAIALIRVSFLRSFFLRFFYRFTSTNLAGTLDCRVIPKLIVAGLRLLLASFMSLLGVAPPITLPVMEVYESTKPIRLWNAVFVVCLLFVGCKPSAVPQRVTQLKQFQETMAEIDAVIEPGMLYSDLVRQIGEPFISSTNGDDILAIYHFDPALGFYGVTLTNGYRVDVSKGLVVKKSVITGTLQLPRDMVKPTKHSQSS